MTEHETKFEAVAQAIGIDKLRAILESDQHLYRFGKTTRFSFPTPAEMAELAKADEHLNNVALAKWDACDGKVRELVRASKAAKSWSLSDTVCVLKHVAKFHYTETLAETEAKKPKPPAPEPLPEPEPLPSIADFIQKHGIKFECHRVYDRPDGLMTGEGSDNMRHFRCRIISNRELLGRVRPRSFGLYFSQGSAHTQDPTLADVLDCLASDASGYENARNFDDWASEYGYDTDSRKAEKTFRAIKRQAEQLKRTLGQEAYEELLWNTERL